MLLRYTFFSILLTIGLLGNSSFGAISAGPENGTYIKVAKDISTIFKKYKANLKVLPSKGSIDNLDALTGKTGKNNAQWAIVQSDALNYYKFLHFKDTREDVTDKVKTILPLYNEHIHILAKKGKKISFKKGTVLKVGISSKASGSNITANIIENAYKVNFKYNYVDFKTGIKRLKENKLDILIDVISFPSDKYKKLSGITLIDIPKNKIMDKRYLRTLFSKYQYSWLNTTVKGYKVPSVLVTNRVDKKYNQTVGIFLKIILNNYKSLIKYGHPKWKESYRNKTLQVDNMHPEAYRLLHR